MGFRFRQRSAHCPDVHDILRVLADLAAGQDGIVAVRQAIAAGATPTHIYRWVGDGRIERIGRRSLLFPGQPRTWRMELRVALVDAGPLSVASHRSAAGLRGFDGFVVPPIEVTVPSDRRDRRPVIGTLYSTRTFPIIDRTVVAGLPCASAVRTIIDLASVCSDLELENAIDSAVRSGQLSIEHLSKRLRVLRTKGRVGVAAFDRVLPDSGGANRLERRVPAVVSHGRAAAAEVPGRAPARWAHGCTRRLRLLPNGVGRGSRRTNRPRIAAPTSTRCGATPRSDQLGSHRVFVHLRRRVRPASGRGESGQGRARSDRVSSRPCAMKPDQKTTT